MDQSVSCTGFNLSLMYSVALVDTLSKECHTGMIGSAIEGSNSQLWKMETQEMCIVSNRTEPNYLVEAGFKVPQWSCLLGLCKRTNKIKINSTMLLCRIE